MMRKNHYTATTLNQEYLKDITERTKTIIVISLQYILDNIYQLLAHSPGCQSFFSTRLEANLTKVHVGTRSVLIARSCD